MYILVSIQKALYFPLSLTNFKQMAVGRVQIHMQRLCVSVCFADMCIKPPTPQSIKNTQCLLYKTLNHNL